VRGSRLRHRFVARGPGGFPRRRPPPHPPEGVSAQSTDRDHRPDLLGHLIGMAWVVRGLGTQRYSDFRKPGLRPEGVETLRRTCDSLLVFYDDRVQEDEEPGDAERFAALEAQVRSVLALIEDSTP
jgi:hypothetical protein